jgi:tetratricopeptide (TPR) repeat protein
MKMNTERLAFAGLMISFAILSVLFSVFRPALNVHLSQTGLPALLSMAAEAEAKEDIASAFEIYSLIESRYEKNEKALLACARFHESRGKMAHAETIYREAATLGRQRFSAVRKYTDFLDRSGRGIEALQVYEDYLRRYPEDCSAQADLGARLLRAGRYGEAEDRFRLAAKDATLRTGVLADLGRALRAHGKASDAVAVWHEVVNTNSRPEAQQLLLDIARANLELGVEKDAGEAYEMYLARFPNSPAAVAELKALYDKSGDAADARRLELAARMLAPEELLRSELSRTFEIYGVSDVPKEVRVEEPFSLAVTFLARDNITSMPLPEVVFWLVQTKEGGEAFELESIPAVVAASPLWKGCTVAGRFALIAGADRVKPGRYRLIAGLRSPATGPRAFITSVDVLPSEKGGAS